MALAAVTGRGAEASAGAAAPVAGSTLCGGIWPSNTSGTSFLRTGVFFAALAMAEVAALTALTDGTFESQPILYAKPPTRATKATSAYMNLLDRSCSADFDVAAACCGSAIL